MASPDHVEPRRRSKLRSDTAILLALGFVLFSSGTALVAAPEYSQRARNVADFLARFAGIQSGLLMLGGLVFFSLGVLSRGITRLSSSVATPAPRPEQEDRVDVSLAVEQLAGDVAQLRTTFHQVSGDIEKTTVTLQQLLEAHEAFVQLQGQAPVEDQGQKPLDNDPLFLLAGSLDQLNARLDERLIALTARIDERLASLPDPGKASTDGHGPLERTASLVGAPPTRPSHPAENDGLQLRLTTRSPAVPDVSPAHELELPPDAA